MGSEYTHMIINLFIVLAVIIFAFFLIRKLKWGKIANNKLINILNIVPIGSKEKILLMEVNKKILLIGATPNHIETLYVFNELETATVNEAKEKDFAEQLSSVMQP